MDTNEDSPSACVGGRALPPIFKLPDETLLTIAGLLAENRHLVQLSRVNTKFRHVAQEALVKRAILPPNGIGKLVKMLCDRPDLAAKIKSVDLGDYQYEATHPEQENPGPGQTIDEEQPHLLKKCRILNDLTNGDAHWAEIVEAMTKPANGIWTIDRDFFINVLVALSPNLKHLTMRLPKTPDRHPWDQEDFKLYEPFPKAASNLLRNRLRILDIQETISWKSLTTYNVNLRSLSSLVRLSLPMDAFVDPNGQPTDPVEVIPPKLEWLQLRPCNKYIQPWISGLRQARSNAEFPHWHRLDLFFNSCIRTTLLLIDQGCGLLSAFTRDVALLSQNDLTVGYFHGSNEQNSGDLVEELDARAHLSDFEAWLAASREQTFSASVARTESGAPRRRTRLETRYFLRNSKGSVKRRKISRFNPRVCLDEIPQLTFTTKKNIKLRPQCAPTVEVWARLSASYKESKLTIAHAPIAQIASRSQTTVRSTYDFTTFEHSSIPPRVATFNAKFNASEWVGTEFFFPNRNSSVRRQSQRTSRKTMTRPAIKSRSSSPRPRRLKQVV